MKILSTITSWYENDSPRLLYTILILTFVIRLGFVLVLDPNKFYFSDTRHYDGAAMGILDGSGFGEKYNRAPGYPVFMAAIYGLFGHSFVVMRIAEVFVGVAIVLLLYLICRKAFDRKTALVAAAIAMIFPHFILIPGILYSTNLFTFLLASSVILLLMLDDKPDYRLLIAAALIAGLTALTIPSFFFILPFWLLWLLFKPGEKFGVRFLHTALYLIVFCMTLVPWTVRNYHIYHRLTLVRPVPSSVLPDLDNIEAHKKEIESGFKKTTEYLRENPYGSEKDKVGNFFLHYLKHPWGTIKFVVSELGHFYALYPDRMDTANPEYHKKISAKDKRFANTFGGKWGLVKIASIIVMAPIFLLALIGVVRRETLRRKRLLLLMTVLSVSVGYSMILSEVRYRIPVEPYILMFTAAGLVWLWEKTLGRKAV